MTGKGMSPVFELADISVLVGNRFPQVPAGSADPTKVEGWAEAVAFEKSAAAADWECRGAAASRVIEGGTDELAAWAAEHESELDALAAEWAALPAERDKAKAAAANVVKR
ncbi:hypothetical protein ACQPZJ_22220 [Actinoplanes sp. CA-054009]